MLLLRLLRLMVMARGQEFLSASERTAVLHRRHRRQHLLLASRRDEIHLHLARPLADSRRLHQPRGILFVAQQTLDRREDILIQGRPTFARLAHAPHDERVELDTQAMQQIQIVVFHGKRDPIIDLELESVTAGPHIGILDHLERHHHG